MRKAALVALAWVVFGFTGRAMGAAGERAGAAVIPAPAPAAARQVSLAEPPPADAAADQFADYAAQLFKQQRYSEAGDALKQAFEREPRPIFLFNAGQTYRKCGRYADAVAAYARFLELAPQHSLASEARGYQSTLTVLVEQQQRNSQIEMTLMGKEAEAEQARHTLALEQRKREDLQSALAAEKAKQKPVYRRPWFWALMTGVAVGAVAVGLSVISWNNGVATPGMNQTFTFQ